MPCVPPEPGAPPLPDTHFVPSPTKPARQTQVKPPAMFVQVALPSQLLVPAAHSSMSSAQAGPVQPFGQMHAKTPALSRQVPPFWHGLGEQRFVNSVVVTSPASKLVRL